MNSIRGYLALALLGWVGVTTTGCSTTGNRMDAEAWKNQKYETGDVSDKGYRYDEAKAFIEFCVDLDSQDDRVKDKNPEFNPRVDPNLWTQIYDSRSAVAKDVVRFRDHGTDEQTVHWRKLFEKIVDRANSKYKNGWQEQTVSDDPDLNGFGPWQNAWLLYEGKGAYKGSYAIAIRGTVFSNEPSVAEDAIFHPVAARAFLSHAVQFADADNATLHSGFAHATFTLMLDDRYGILRVLHDKHVATGSRLYIVGHSQGAAMATITHAFLHYAMRTDDLSGAPAFGLKGMGYKLKSYGFAQPKPGNYAFSTDFARITQAADNAIVINNHIDPVPKVPLTLQAAGDLDSDFKGSSFGLRTLHFFAGIGSSIRGVVSFFGEPFARKSAEGYGYFYNYDNIKPLGSNTTASSWDFSPAGRVVMVFGTPGDPNDVFLQHHATTYRRLIAEQLNN